MQCEFKAISGPINVRINIPGSKKISNRALMLAALADGVSEITGINFNEYTKGFIHALQQAGIVIQADPENASCIVAGCNGKLPKKQATIWCGEVETAARYLLSTCASSPGTYYLDGNEALHQTNITNQLNQLRRVGAQTIPPDNNRFPLTVAGADSLDGGELHFEKQTLSSVLTSFLLLAPYARAPFSFIIPSNNKQNYIAMTCQMMAEFGVLVRRMHRGQFMVPVPQRYHARDYSVEPDLTLMAFFFAATVATGGTLTIQPFKRSRSKQIDVKSLRIFEKLNSHLLESSDGFTLEAPAAIPGIELTIKKFSASVAALLSIAPFAESPTTIAYSKTFWTRKKHWLQSLKLIYDQLHLRMQLSESHLKIFPGNPRPAIIDARQDIHLSLILAVLGTRCESLVITNMDYLLKLYPSFFQLWEGMTDKAKLKISA